MNYLKHTWVTGETVTAGKLNDLENAVAAAQEKLTAGANIQLNNNVISATDTKYTAGTNITIDENNKISASGGGGEGIMLADMSGTLTDAQLAKLQASTNNFIICKITRYGQDFNVRVNYAGKDLDNNGLMYSNCHTNGFALTGYEQFMVSVEVVLETKAYTVIICDTQPKLTAGDGISINPVNQAIAAKDQKNWRTLTITPEQLIEISLGNTINGTLSSAISTAEFKRNYFVVEIDTTPYTIGEQLKPGDPYSNLYLDFVDDSFTEPNVQVRFQDDMANFGKLVGRYLTFISTASCNDAEELVRYGSIYDEGVVCVQDITPQDWEISDESEKPKEGLSPEQRDHIYVIGLTYEESRQGIAISYENSHAAYLDGDEVKWAYTVKGYAYPVTYDGEYDRWFVTPVTVGEEVYATALTDEEKQALLNTGFTFTAGEVAANTLYDNDSGVAFGCAGLYNEPAAAVISWNDKFQEPTERQVRRLIGRPGGLFRDTTTFINDEGEEEVTNNGYYVWTVSGNSINGIIQIPSAKLNAWSFIPSGAKQSGEVAYNQTTVYRHSFTLNTPKEGFAQLVGQWAVRISFLAVNKQGGMNMQYLLHSDESLESDAIDWLLPAHGIAGEVDDNGEVTKWHEVLNICAGYVTVGEDVNRTLFVDYLDDDYEIARIAVINDQNSDYHEVDDIVTTLDTFISLGGKTK